MITWAKSWYVLGVAIRFYSILFYFNLVNLEAMKTFVLIFLLGCFSFVGYSIHPIDPPKKGGETDKTVAPPIPVATDQCSGSTSVVPVTVEVTITDCPDYDCSLPGPTCNIQLCIYQDDCNGSPLACTTFYPDTCSYRIEVRAEEYSTLYSKLVVTGCTNHWNTVCISCSPVVPPGGGTVYCNREFCP